MERTTKVTVARPFNRTPQGGGMHEPGDTVEVPIEHAKDLVRLGLADLATPEPEQSAAPTPQNKMAPEPANKADAIDEAALRGKSPRPRG